MQRDVHNFNIELKAVLQLQLSKVRLKCMDNPCVKWLHTTSYIRIQEKYGRMGQLALQFLIYYVRGCIVQDK